MKARRSRCTPLYLLQPHSFFYLLMANGRARTPAKVHERESIAAQSALVHAAACTLALLALQCWYRSNLKWYRSNSKRYQRGQYLECALSGHSVAHVMCTDRVGKKL